MSEAAIIDEGQDFIATELLSELRLENDRKSNLN